MSNNAFPDPLNVNVVSPDPLPVELVTEVLQVNLANTAQVDAFSRLRTSNPETLFDSKQIFDNQPMFWDDQEVSGSGTTSVYSVNTASSVMGVANVTAGKRIRQTFMRFNYQSGKSQLVTASGTFDLSGGGAGITRAFGYFDDNNGIFYKLENDIFYAVIRSSTSGSPVDNAVAQADWNIDKLDGNGPSGITLDLTKSSIIYPDFEWLSAGRVRMSMVMAGIPILTHEFNHSNILQGAYMSTPNLPMRYEIENDGTGAASTMEQICASVMSEGGSQDNGSLRYFSTKSSKINVNVVGDLYVVVGLRLKSTHCGATIKIESLSAINDTNDDYEWVLVFNPTVSTPVSFNDLPNSALQVAIGNAGNPSTSTVTGGTESSGGMIKSGGNAGSFYVAANNAIRLGESISGTVDEVYLCVRPLSSNANISGGIGWREIS